MNYNELPTGTELARLDNKEPKTQFKFIEQLNNGKIAVDLFDEEGNWLGCRYFNQDNFEKLFGVVKKKTKKEDEDEG